jgi:cation diffusion facilitator family transporter
MDKIHPRQRLNKILIPTLWGLFVNSLLAAVKLFAGIVGASHALVADGIESLADVVSSIIVLRGLKIAAEPPDREHPYGHGKAEPIAAAMVSGMLFLAAGWITLQAIQELLKPIPHLPAPFTLIVLIIIIVIKEFLYRFTSKIGEATDSLAVQGDAWHHRSDAISSLTAAVGIGICLIGGNSYAWADKVAAIVGAILISWNALKILRPALDDLMDKAPEHEIVQKIRTIASETPEVERIEKCHIRKIGYYYMVDIHVEVNRRMTIEDAHNVAHHVKDRLQKQITSIRDVLVHLEPDLTKPAGKRN